MRPDPYGGSSVSTHGRRHDDLAPMRLVDHGPRLLRLSPGPGLTGQRVIINSAKRAGVQAKTRPARSFSQTGLAPAAMRRLISEMLAFKPMKMASAIKKWPMFSSTISGMAATSDTFSNVSPWPAWHSILQIRVVAAARTSRSSSARRDWPSVPA